jgi:hypothetical protein
LSRVVIKECHTYDTDAVTEAFDSGLALLGGWDSF